MNRRNLCITFIHLFIPRNFSKGLKKQKKKKKRKNRKKKRAKIKKNADTNTISKRVVPHAPQQLSQLSYSLRGLQACRGFVRTIDIL